MYKIKPIIKKTLKGDLAMSLIQIVLMGILVLNLVFIARPSAVTFGGTLFVYTSAYSSLSALSYPIYILMFVFFCDAFLKKGNGKIFITVFTIISFLTIIASFGLELIERLKYPNYVYSNFHIYIPALVGFSYIQLAVFLCGFYFLFQSKYFYLLKNNSIISPSNILKFLLIVVVYSTLVTMPSFISDEYIQQRNNYAMRAVDIRYRTTDLSQLSRELLFVRENTPEDSIIVHPPQSADFPDVGNQVLLRYYLYPRTLVTYKSLGQFIKDNRDSKCKMYTLVSRSGVDKEYIFPAAKDLLVNNTTLYSYDGKVTHYDSKKFNKNQITNENFLVGVIENTRCSAF